MKNLILVLALCGCGKGGAQTAVSLRQTTPSADPLTQAPTTPVIPKSIFSLWNDIDGNHLIDSVEFFQSGSVNFTVSNNTCSCSGTIDTNNGIVNETSCPVSNQGTDCSIYLGQYTYQIDNTNTLKMCPSVGSCAKFQ